MRKASVPTFILMDVFSRTFLAQPANKPQTAPFPGRSSSQIRKVNSLAEFEYLAESKEPKKESLFRHFCYLLETFSNVLTWEIIFPTLCSAD
ncbi:hypothetical protein [Pantoea allii]|uniref:hypothetical protein n=1 Tax=Pantoea allii TaxID=574096 RepID=UPI0015E7FD6A|nr:hypothetical protein [Pantoea allii]